jgi:hypothetical protein
MSKEDQVRVDASDGDNPLFPPHGVYEGRINDGIFRAHVTGPVNRELVLSLSHKISDLFRALQTERKAGGITEFHESMIFTHEALVAHRDLIADGTKLLTQGMVVAHVAAPTVEGRELMAGIFARTVYGPLNIPYQCFDTVAEAESWVHDQISAG